MKCPKCGYHSFDHLDSCKKCGHGLAEHKAKFNLRGFYFSGNVASSIDSATAAGVEMEEEAAPEDNSVDLGFDFLDEPDDRHGKVFAEISLGDDSQMLSINQPFGVDSEKVPADNLGSDSGDKPGKGPEFAF